MEVLITLMMIFIIILVLLSEYRINLKEKIIELYKSIYDGLYTDFEEMTKIALSKCEEVRELKDKIREFEKELKEKDNE